jgi:hypothetical protein
MTLRKFKPQRRLATMFEAATSGGLTNKPLTLTSMPTRREDVAHHEAGHAVLAVLYGATVVEVSIVSDGHCADGYCEDVGLFRANDSDYALINHAIRVCLAGPVAQRHFDHATFHRLHGRVDYRSALGLCYYIVPERPREPLAKQEQETVRLVRRYWSDIERVAQALLEHDVLDFWAVRRLLNQIAGVLATDHRKEDRVDRERWERAEAATDPHIWSR